MEKNVTLVDDSKETDNHKVTLYRIEDEIASGVTHGIGLMMAFGGLCSLIVLTTARGSIWQIVGCTVFGISLVILYLASTLYHFVQEPVWKESLRKLDHVAIYLLIAGTYTPFTLVNLHGVWSWILFGLVWGLATFGIVAKIWWGDRWQWLSLAAYLGLGWSALIAARPIIESIPMAGLGWLLAGGLAYTFGVIFFAFDRIRYFHAIWHIFVMMGSVFHFCAVIFYVVPKL
jgi:hemolysin III